MDGRSEIGHRRQGRKIRGRRVGGNARAWQHRAASTSALPRGTRSATRSSIRVRRSFSAKRFCRRTAAQARSRISSRSSAGPGCSAKRPGAPSRPTARASSTRARISLLLMRMDS